MEGFIAFVIGAVAAIAALAILYANKDYTFPGVPGKGGLGMALVVALGGVLAVYLLGLAAGSSNVFLDIAAHMEFYLTYNDLLVKVGGWVALIGLSFLAGVVTYNEARSGQALQ